MSNEFEAATKAMKNRNAAFKVDIAARLREWGVDVSKCNGDSGF